MAASAGRRRKRGDWPVVVRFHLGPGLAATPTADGAGALVKLPGGKVWALKAEGATLTIEPSVVVDADGHSQRSQQLTQLLRGKLKGQTQFFKRSRATL